AVCASVSSRRIISDSCCGFERLVFSLFFPTRRSAALLAAEVDHPRAGRAGDVRADRGDRAAPDQHLARAERLAGHGVDRAGADEDRKSTRLNSSHVKISYAVFCLEKKNRGNARGRVRL